MSIVSPTQIKAGIKKNTNAWNGGPVAVGADSQIFFTNTPLPVAGRQYVEDPTQRGAGGLLPDILSSVEPELPLEMVGVYNGAILGALGLFFGGSETFAEVTAAGPVTIGGSHRWDIAADVVGKHFTYAQDLVNTIAELDQAKVSRFGISWSQKEAPMFSFTIKGRQYRQTGDAGILNDATAIGNLTYEDTYREILPGQLVVRLNAQSGGALGDPEKIVVTGLELTFERDLDGPVTNASHPYRDELTAAKPGWSATLGLTIAQWQNTNLETYNRNGVVAKGDVTFTGPLLPGADAAQAYSMKFELPALVMDGYERSEENALGEQVSFKVRAALAAPTGMSGITVPRLTIVNERQSAY